MSTNITFFQGQSIFDSKAQALVNPVNCVGVMGKGLALQFAQRYPHILPPYRDVCKDQNLRPGGLYVIDPDPKTPGSPYVVCMATKGHWKDKSQVIWVRTGLENLAKWCAANNIRHVAIPPVGCGLGGLQWEVIKPHLLRILKAVPRLDVYEP